MKGETARIVRVRTMQQTGVLMVDQVSLCALLRSPQFSGNRGVGAGLPLSAENPEDAQRLKVTRTQSRETHKQTGTNGRKKERNERYGGKGDTERRARNGDTKRTGTDARMK